MFSKGRITRLTNILTNYTGNNPELLKMKRLCEFGKLEFNEFNAKYINENKDFKVQEVNKIISITDECGKMLCEKYNITDFIPTKIWIGKVIGKIGLTYHCYVQFRKSIPPQLMYIKKNYIMDSLFTNNMNEYDDIDFDKYDKLTEKEGRKLREHQKEAVKFLLANKKCILADQQGLGKTTSAIVAALEGGFEKILVITTASLKTTWKKEIELYADSADITIMNGSRWVNPNRINIVNYDIMQNFYSVPYEEVDTQLNNDGTTVKKRVKSHKKAIIKENLDKSPIFQEHFNCVIIDEAHKLSNNTSIRYNTIFDFLNRTKPEAIFLLTGTPLTNRPINLYTVLKLIKAEVTDDYEYYVKRFCDAKKMTRNGRTFYITSGASNLDELKNKIKHLYLRRLQSDIPGMVNKTILTREYDLNERQKARYDEIWEEYVDAQNKKGNINATNYRDLVEGILVRQFLAQEMIPNTIDLADSHIDYGEKVIIICTFQEELENLKKHYKDKAVIYNGKMNTKQKDEAVNKFLNDDKVMVMIANIVAVSVGLSLISSHFLIFNSYSWESALNLQAMDRIYRLTQTEDVTCIYQLFTDSISKDMFNKVMLKEYIMNATIKSEKEKNEK